jgi:monoamine oxidase
MTEAPHFAEIVVIGAGAAGLACARDLLRAGHEVMVVEVKSLIGGRIHSVRAPNAQYPLELGAEFIHGASPVLLAALQDTNLRFYDVPDKHLLREKAKLKNVDFFARTDRVMERVRKQKRDITVAEFAASERNKENLDIFISYVEGFHAADTGLIGTEALARAEESEDPELNGISLFRMTNPYVAFLQDWVAPDHIAFNIRVREIEWEAGRVNLNCTGPKGDFSLQCRKVVVTLPIGVLHAPAAQGGLHWNPLPDQIKRILEGVEMGHVQKLIFGFHNRFWEKMKTDEPISFLHASAECDFPTWWTSAPMRTLYLTAWQGGPRALEMAAWPAEDRIESALKTLARITGKRTSWLRAEMQTIVTHNWSLDTAAFGAYSYVRRGGVSRAKLFNRPIEDTIFLAGEAGSLSSGRGTVHGAIGSGIETAGRVLKTYKS